MNIQQHPDEGSGQRAGAGDGEEHKEEDTDQREPFHARIDLQKHPHVVMDSIERPLCRRNPVEGLEGVDKEDDGQGVEHPDSHPQLIGAEVALTTDTPQGQELPDGDKGDGGQAQKLQGGLRGDLQTEEDEGQEGRSGPAQHRRALPPGHVKWVKHFLGRLGLWGGGVMMLCLANVRHQTRQP